MKSIRYILSFLIFISCNNSVEIEKRNIELTVVEDAAKEGVSVIEELNEIDVIDKDTIINFETNRKITILIPGTYRDGGGNNLVDCLTENWVGLYQENGAYYLEKANYTIHRSIDECSGDSTQTIESINKTLLYINNGNLQLGKIDNQKITKNKIWPNEEMVFVFNNDVYKIRAEGDIVSSENVTSEEGTEIFHEVENYKLFISMNDSKEVLFLEESTFNDTFVELLFIGDIDNDNKLDFIFGANRYYEETRVILYLSSEASKESVVKKKGEISINFDC